MIGSIVKTILRLVTPRFYYPINQYFLLRMPLVWSSRIITVMLYCVILGSTLGGLAIIFPISIERTFYPLHFFIRFTPVVFSVIGFILWAYYQSQYDYRRGYGFNSRFFELKSALLYVAVPILFAGLAFGPNYILSKRLVEITETHPRVISAKEMINADDIVANMPTNIRMPKSILSDYRYMTHAEIDTIKIFDKVYQYNDVSVKNKSKLKKIKTLRDVYTERSFKVYKYEDRELIAYRNRYFDDFGFLNVMRFEAWLERYADKDEVDIRQFGNPNFALDSAGTYQFIMAMQIIRKSLKAHHNTSTYRTEPFFIWTIAILITSFFLSSGTGAINMFGRKELGFAFLKALFLIWAIMAVLTVIEIAVDADGDFIFGSFIVVAFLLQIILYFKKRALILWIITTFSGPIAVGMLLALFANEVNLEAPIEFVVACFLIGYFIYLPVHKLTLYKIYSMPQ